MISVDAPPLKTVSQSCAFLQAKSIKLILNYSPCRLYLMGQPAFLSHPFFYLSRVHLSWIYSHAKNGSISFSLLNLLDLAQQYIRWLQRQEYQVKLVRNIIVKRFDVFALFEVLPIWFFPSDGQPTEYKWAPFKAPSLQKKLSVSISVILPSLRKTPSVINQC